MEFSHLDSKGRVKMVDISGKPLVKRTAVARGAVFLGEETIQLIEQGGMKKGDPLACARVAAIMGAKKTGELIPLCHPLPLDLVSIDFSMKPGKIEILATVVTTARTGVEMEALTAVSTAALTIYDMCKAVDKKMVIGDISLVSKKKEPL
ncbi:MAG: cyclic pyranopterin monophosphate synthase MoaC [Candidatus Krumholzibacteriota bacterium]|nr:cyclic pyranopterin monophosphate synthase MoaC [Candidatus Krumholzibacteriota bacterium]